MSSVLLCTWLGCGHTIWWPGLCTLLVFNSIQACLSCFHLYTCLISLFLLILKPFRINCIFFSCFQIDFLLKNAQNWSYQGHGWLSILKSKTFYTNCTWSLAVNQSINHAVLELLVFHIWLLWLLHSFVSFLPYWLPLSPNMFYFLPKVQNHIGVDVSLLFSNQDHHFFLTLNDHNLLFSQWF